MANAKSGGVRVWEDLRKQARKLEGELDVKLAAYGKLCASFGGIRGSIPMADQVNRNKVVQQKAGEVNALLQLLTDVNHDMSESISGAVDSRSHTMARHRDILQNLTQEFQRLESQLGVAQDRADLLAGGGEGMPLLGVQIHGQSAAGPLLRERATISISTNHVDDMLAQAQSVSRSLLEQRRVFWGVQDKLGIIGERFPAINGLLSAIRRRKYKDTLVLSGVIGTCLVVTFIYVFVW